PIESLVAGLADWFQRRFRFVLRRRGRRGRGDEDSPGQSETPTRLGATGHRIPFTTALEVRNARSAVIKTRAECGLCPLAREFWFRRPRAGADRDTRHSGELPLRWSECCDSLSLHRGATMRRQSGAAGLLVGVGLLLAATPAHALITSLTPLRGVLE